MSVKKSFYNTLNYSGPDLERAHARAAAQEQFVLALFRQNPTRHISPSHVQVVASAKYGRHCPLTSWRRAITNLTKAGRLTKCGKGHMTEGQFGLKEHTWQYNEAGDTKALESFFSDLQEGKLEGRATCSAVSPAPAPMHCAPKMFIQQELFV